MLHFLVANTQAMSVFSFQRSFTFLPTTTDGVSDIESASSVNSTIEDRKTSLFGFTILPSDDNKFVIVSAPGRKRDNETYGGDFFKCSVDDLENSCQSLLKELRSMKTSIYLY
ncbi:hypothetical protein RF11_08193 [Thelohanellus kitauei]|uniref:Uncharacterized protein n=1 Tax=Thelohanellus kitauei TaxID=669202 RepID=A0A0C2NIG1_THEKT|nr:hypothetical protein RF11_08193 [Thelohanellus kitauei]